MKKIYQIFILFALIAELSACSNGTVRSSNLEANDSICAVVESSMQEEPEDKAVGAEISQAAIKSTSSKEIRGLMVYVLLENQNLLLTSPEEIPLPSGYIIQPNMKAVGDINGNGLDDLAIIITEYITDAEGNRFF